MGFEDKTRLPFIERPDLSPFLIHLTKRTDENSAFENLIEILKTGKIKGSTTATGYVQVNTPAACFMDVPLGSLKYVLNKAQTKTTSGFPRYEPYGVLISKSWAYDAGARPVLYLSKDEQKFHLKVPPDELWRVVRFEGVSDSTIGWLHEREWRAKGNFKLPPSMLAVLVKSPTEAKKLQTQMTVKPQDFKATALSVLPLRIVCQGLPY